jgi:hypothetical protein
MSLVQILPKTHMLQGIVAADNWTVAKAISEFVDNSFGSAAGDADVVGITFGSDFIAISDNGNGMQDVTALFVIGESGSFSSDVDIGRYGRGAKEACIWLGRKTMVESRHGGIRSVAHLDWQKVIDSGPDAPWPTVEVTSHKVGESISGTRIKIEGMRQKRRINIDALRTALGETYAMAIRNGKIIRLTDARKGGIAPVDVEPFYPKGWSDIQSVKGRVNGKGYSAEVGILSEVYSSHTGLRVCYGHRVIERMTVLGGRAVPARVFGYVMLDSSWKPHLSTNKTELIDSDDLEADLLEKLAVVFKAAEEYQEDWIIEGLNVHLSDVLTKSWRASDEGDQYGKRKEPKNPGTKTKKHKAPPMTVTEDGEVPVQESLELERRGLQIKKNRLGKDGVIGLVQEADNGLIVVLNQDSPLMKRAINDQMATGKNRVAAYAMIVGFLLSNHAHDQGPTWARQTFGTWVSDERSKVRDSVLTWWSTLATKPLWSAKIEEQA